MTIKHLSDSAHWYTRSGEPAYDADLRRARKELLIPSITTILKIIDKPQLTNWLMNTIIDMAAKTPRVAGEDDFAWIMRVSALAQIERDKPAQRGTEIHGMIEEYLLTGELPDDSVGNGACLAIRGWLDGGGMTVLASEKTFVNVEEGVAGRVDLDLSGGIADIKTTKKPPKKKPWDNWVWQLSGYFISAKREPGPAYNLVIDSMTGEFSYHKIEAEDIARGMDTFRKIRDAWIAVKGYCPKGGGING